MKNKLYKLGDVVTIEYHEGCSHGGCTGILVEQKESTYWFVQFSESKGDIKGFPESMFLEPSVKVKNPKCLESKECSYIKMELNSQGVYILRGNSHEE